MLRDSNKQLVASPGAPTMRVLHGRRFLKKIEYSYLFWGDKIQVLDFSAEVNNASLFFFFFVCLFVCWVLLISSQFFWYAGNYSEKHSGSCSSNANAIVSVLLKDVIVLLQWQVCWKYPLIAHQIYRWVSSSPLFSHHNTHVFDQLTNFILFSFACVIFVFAGQIGNEGGGSHCIFNFIEGGGQEVLTFQFKTFASPPSGINNDRTVRKGLREAGY